MKQYIYIVEQTFFYKENGIDYQGAHNAGDNHYFNDLESAEEYVNVITSFGGTWESTNDLKNSNSYEAWKYKDDEIRNYIAIYKIQLP